MENLMIDLETMGQDSNAAIVSLAAVEFDLETGTTGRVFYRRISLASCQAHGLHIDAETVMWWLKQSKNAQKELFNEPSGLQDVLIELSWWINDGQKVWGNSARFDLGILANAFIACDVQIPWNHYDERCVRTLAALRPEIKKNLQFEGVKHHPVDDCRHQIRYCHATWKALNQVTCQ